MKQTIGMSVNEIGLKKQLSNMFAGASSLIRECAQNARRAKAQNISISHHKDDLTLVIENDGEIMRENDWQKLFGLFDSGWGADIATEENPFGIGSTSMIVCASHITIQSGEYITEFDTDLLLGGARAEIHAIKSTESPLKGTRFTLKIKSELWDNLGLDELSESFVAFPVPVTVNGIALSNDCSLNNPNVLLHAFEYGVLAIPKDLINHQNINSSIQQYSIKLAAQGLLVEPPTGAPYKVEAKAVVHLNENLIKLSSPDRTRIIDGPSDLLQARLHAYAIGINKLLEIEVAKDGLFAAASRWFNLFEAYHPDALEQDEAPVATSDFFIYSCSPYQLDEYSDFDNEFMAWGSNRKDESKYVPSSSLEAGFLIFEDLDYNPLQNSLIRFHNFAADFNVPVLDGSGISSSHSVYKRGLYKETQILGDWQVDAINPSQAQSVSFLGNTFNVVFHDGLTVTPPSFECATGDIVQWGKGVYSDEQYFADKEILYVGRKFKNLNDFVSQLSAFNAYPDSDIYERSSEAEEDAQIELFRIVSALNGQDICQVVSELMLSARSELEQIHTALIGKTFALTFDKHGHAHVTEQ